MIDYTKLTDEEVLMLWWEAYLEEEKVVYGMLETELNDRGL